jgi:hypothetical protein
VLVAVAVIAIQLSGCAAYPTDSEPLAENYGGEPLIVEVNGEVIEPEADALWSASVDGRRVVLTVPESGGCTKQVELSKVDVTSKTIDVVATSKHEGPCAANLFLTPKELLVDTDVRGFTVHVRVDEG